MRAGASPGDRAIAARTAVGVVLLALLAASLTKVGDNDTYMHLSLGRVIADAGGLPEHEPFSYPSEDQPFSYSSWLFGVTLHLLHAAGGGVALSLFKALLMWATVVLVYLDSTTPPRRVPWLALAGVVVAYALMQDRFALRPELLGVVCLAASVWLLDRFWYLDERRGLFALPVIACLWANSHSSVTLGFLVFGAFVFGALTQRGAGARRVALEPVAAGKLGVLLAVAFASFAASLVSPYGVDQYLHAVQYHEVLWYQQSILELQPVAGMKLHAHAILVALVAASFVAARRRLSLAHLALVAPLLAMPFQSTRYTLFAVVVAVPVIVRNLGPAADAVRARRGRVALAALPAAALGVLAVLLLPVLDSPLRAAPFGLGLRERHALDGAAGFLHAQGIRGRVLNDFNSGTYLIWRGYPRLTVFVESRGYVSPQRLEDAQQYVYSAQTTDRLYEEYGFQAIVAENLWGGVGGREEATRVHDAHTGIDRRYWALVFWDDSALVYLRRDGEYAALAGRLEYRHVQPDRSLATFIKSLPARRDLAELERELGRATAEDRSLYARALLAVLYNSSARQRDTVALLGDEVAGGLAGASSGQRRFVVELLADAHASTGEPAEAERLYLRALAFVDDNLVHYKLARLYRGQGRIDEAIEHLERAARLAPGDLPIRLELAAAYRAGGNGEAADRTAREAQALRARRSMQVLLREGVKAQMAGDFTSAEALYRQVLEAGPDATTLTNLAFVELDTGRGDAAEARFRSALEVDPRHANAHYGLALAARERGDVAAQIQHFRSYLELAPAGYFHRQAVAELGRLGAR